MDSNPADKYEGTPSHQREPDKESENPEQPISPTSTRSKPQPPHAHYQITCNAEKDWWDKAKRYVELAGVIFLALYTGVTGLMYCVNKKSAEAAQDAAVAAKSSADTAKTALHTTQRAYIDVTTPDLNVIKDPQGKLFGIGVRVEWENSGFTRAPYMVSHINIAKLPYALPKKFTFPDRCEPNEDCTNVQSVVAPHQSVGGFLDPITASELDSMVAKKLHVYCYGWSAYRDIFYPNTETHLTEFCTELGFTNPVQYTDGHPVVVASNCKVPNCADEDCGDYRRRTQNGTK